MKGNQFKVGGKYVTRDRLLKVKTADSVSEKIIQSRQTKKTVPKKRVSKRLKKIQAQKEQERWRVNPRRSTRLIVPNWS